MKKPSADRKLISIDGNSLLDIYVSLDSDYFRTLADYMDSKDIKHIEITCEGYDSDVIIHASKLETEEEASKRYTKELKAYEKEKIQQQKLEERKRADLIKEAKKLGLKVAEE